jgi:DNA-binding MurR/RpiR family transcriptional regulator
MIHATQPSPKRRRGPAGSSPQAGRGILERLAALKTDLSPISQQIISYILFHPNDALHMSVTELAEATGTSQASVVRVCQRAGAKGFRDLKLALARDLVESATPIHEDVGTGDTIATMLEKVFFSNIQTLTNTLKLLDANALQKAVDIILAAQEIQCYGLAVSALVAMDISIRLRSLGLRCVAVTDTFLQATSAALSNEHVAVIVVSHTGKTKDILEATRLAKQAGATIICITRYGKSPIQDFADVILHTVDTESLGRTYPLMSRTAQLSIVDALYVGVALSNPERSLECIELSAKINAHKRLS